MSNVILNHVDQDLIELEISQHGANNAEVMLKDELLDGTKSYHFAVNSLSVPMRNSPINNVTVDTTLFTIHRRVQGISPTVWRVIYNLINDNPDDAVALGLLEAAADQFAVGIGAAIGGNDAATALNILQIMSPIVGTAAAANTAQQLVAILRAANTFNPAVKEFTISPNRPQYSVAEFVQEIQQSVDLFNRQVTEEGLPNSRYGLAAGFNVPAQVIANVGDIREWFNINTNCDSALLFEPRTIGIGGAKHFSNYFYLEFSGYGAALLGIPLADLYKRSDTAYFLAATTNSYTNAALDGNNRFVAPANTASVLFSSRHPVYSTADQRVKISVGSHLPILSNTAINNETQISDRDIAEAFFENVVTSEVTYTAGVFDSRLVSRVYAGQCNMIKKYDSHHQWNRLLTSYRLRYLRFYIYVTYRDYQVATDRFVMVKRSLKVEPHEYWNMTIKFVSDV